MKSGTPLSVLDPPGSPSVEATYERMGKNIAAFKKHTPGPLTLAEKIIYGHLDDANTKITRGKTYLNLRPVRFFF